VLVKDELLSYVALLSIYRAAIAFSLLSDSFAPTSNCSITIMSRLIRFASILSLARLGFALLPIPSIIPFAADGLLDA
jgi:hypothetical protein